MELRSFEKKKAKMELVDKGFSQKIVDKYTNLKLFSTNFAPIISKRRVIPHRRWLELVYALPYLVLRREILNSFIRTKNVFASAKQTFFIHLDFPRSPYEYITSRSHRFLRRIMNIQDPRSRIQVKPVSGLPYPVSSSFVNHVNSRGFYFKSYSIAEPITHENSRIERGKESAIANYQLQLVSPKPSTVSNNNLGTHIPHSTSDLITPPFRYYSLGKEVRQRIHRYIKSSSIAEPISHENSRIETGKESAITNYQLQLVNHKPSAVSNNNLGTHIPPGTSDFINLSSFNFINKKNEQKQLEIKKVPLYHTYPRIEHVTSTHTELIKEKVIEKEDKPPHATPQIPSFDLNRLTDQIYPLLERKIRIERERRGLLCL